MKVKIVEMLCYYSALEVKLNNTIKELEQYYEIIDIKYSPFYDSISKNLIYSALIIFKDKGEV